MIQMVFRSKTKYGNKKVIVDGIAFDSKKEANRWCELRVYEKAGIISDLERQVENQWQGGRESLRIYRRLPIQAEWRSDCRGHQGIQNSRLHR